MMLWIILFSMGLCGGVSTECTARGRFPNDIAEDCRGYTTCIPTTTNSYYQYNLICPPQFIYSHFDSQCTNATNGYYCLSSYNCTGIGNFPNPDSFNCSSFITCLQGLDALTARLVDCPANTVYNENDAICVEDTVYTCPQQNSSSNIEGLRSYYLFVFTALNIHCFRN